LFATPKFSVLLHSCGTIALLVIIFKHLRNSYKIAAAFTLFESSLSQSIKPRLRNHNNFGGVLASSSASTTARSRSKQKQSIDQSSVRCRRTSVPVTLPPLPDLINQRRSLAFLHKHDALARRPHRRVLVSCRPV
jgi:hypothetical protein